MAKSFEISNFPTHQTVANNASGRTRHDKERHDKDIRKSVADAIFSAISPRPVGRRQKSSFERAAQRELSERQIYRNLAKHLGVPFVPFPVKLDANISPRDTLKTGLAPVAYRPQFQIDETPVFIYAPDKNKINWLITNTPRLNSKSTMRLGITTPSAFRASVRASFGSQIAESATALLSENRPRASANSIQPILLILIFIVSLLCLGCRIVGPVICWNFALLTMTCFPVLPGIILKWLAYRSTTRDHENIPLLPDKDLPNYTVLVPVYREAAILPQLITALTALDYPIPKLDIKLLLEADDQETLTAIQSLTLPAHFDVLICPQGIPRTKPRALSIGLAYTLSDYVVVFDAEDIPEPDQLKKAASIFLKSNPKLACLQARLAIDNLADSWLTHQFALEYAGLFDVILPGLAALKQPIPLGGTSNHFRREALDAVFGWDPWNVTEDADLGLRLYRSGYRCETFHTTTYEEAPASLSLWINQRTRWIKGWIQTACVHLRSHDKQQDRLTFKRWFALALVACFTPICILYHPALLTLITLISYSIQKHDLTWSEIALQTFSLLLCLSSFYLDLLIAHRGSEKRRIPINYKSIAGLIPYSLLKTYAGWCSLIELFYAPYYWRKTSHGLARTSRLNPDDVKTTS